MNCPKCGGDNPDTSKFCGHCGSRLPAKDPAADIKKTAAFDLGQLPFGGGGNPAPGGGGPTLVQTAVQTAIGAQPDPNAVTTPDPEQPAAPVAAATPAPVAVATPAPATPAPATPTPAPSGPPKADSPPVSASAGPTTVQPVLADEPEAKAEPAPAAPSPAPQPEAQPEPEPEDEPEAQDRTSEEPPPANREFNSAPQEVLAEAPKPKAKTKTKPKAKTKAEPKGDFGADKSASPAPADLGKAAVKSDGTPAPGQFRETKWFMDALDPDKLNRVELEDIRDRGEHFVDDGSEIDESFSLRSGMHGKVRPTQLDLAKAEFEAAERRTKGNGPVIALVLLVLGGIGAAAWFLFLR